MPGPALPGPVSPDCAQAKTEGLPATMTIISRYVFRQAAGSLLLILLSLSGIVWIALALRQLNVVTTQGQDAWQLLKMTTLALPNLMAIIAPFALLIAAIHTLNRLNGDSELIVLTAAGATLNAVAKPLLLLALLVSIFVSVVNHFAMPWSLRQLREAIIDMRADLLAQVIQPGRFSSPEPNLTFHIREREMNGELRGIIMHDTRDPKQSQSYLAEHGQIVKQPPAAYLIMTDGHILRRPNNTEPAQIIVFDKYIVDLARFEQKAPANLELRPRERYYGELRDPSPQAVKTMGGQIRAELHERFASALYPFAFVIIALASVGQAQSTRQNRTEKAIAGFVVAVAARMAGLAANNLAAIKASNVVLLYGVPLGAIAIGLVMMVRGARPHRDSLLLEGLRGAGEAVLAVVRRKSGLASAESAPQ